MVTTCYMHVNLLIYYILSFISYILCGEMVNDAKRVEYEKFHCSSLAHIYD